MRSNALECTGLSTATALYVVLFVVGAPGVVMATGLVRSLRLAGADSERGRIFSAHARASSAGWPSACSPRGVDRPRGADDYPQRPGLPVPRRRSPRGAGPGDAIHDRSRFALGMPELELVSRLQAAATRGWPATVERPAPGGWLLRATPGLDRGRSNNALTPCRELEPAEIVPAIAGVLDFAREHSIRPGIQVSPVDLHGGLQRELDARGWAAQWPTLVLSSAITGTGARRDSLPPELVLADHASAEWLEAWDRCEPGRDVPAHAATVFARLRRRATFARVGTRAVAIVVESDQLAGLFCLAVDPAHRRVGLATAMVRNLLADSGARGAYLQVEEGNLAARSMYQRLGFTETYRYCHRTAP